MCVCTWEEEGLRWVWLFFVARVVFPGDSCIWLYFDGLGSTWRSLAFDFRFTAFYV